MDEVNKQQEKFFTTKIMILFLWGMVLVEETCLTRTVTVEKTDGISFSRKHRRGEYQGWYEQIYRDVLATFSGISTVARTATTPG